MASIPLDQPSRRVVSEATKLADTLLSKLGKTDLTEQQVGNIRRELKPLLSAVLSLRKATQTQQSKELRRAKLIQAQLRQRSFDFISHRERMGALAERLACAPDGTDRSCA